MPQRRNFLPFGSVRRVYAAFSGSRAGCARPGVPSVPLNTKASVTHMERQFSALLLGFGILILLAANLRAAPQLSASQISFAEIRSNAQVTRRKNNSPGITRTSRTPARTESDAGTISTAATERLAGESCPSDQ